MRFLLTQEKEVDMFRNSGRVGVLLMVALVMSLPLFADSTRIVTHRFRRSKCRHAGSNARRS